MHLRTNVGTAVRFVITLALPGAGWAQSPSEYSFSDAHVHLNDPETWMHLMDATGIDRAVVFRGRGIDNAGLLAAAQRRPGRLFPFLSVSPEHPEYRGSWASDDPAFIEDVDSLLHAGGFFGIGEISVSHFPGPGFPEADFDPNGRVMREILTAARRHGLPVTVHVELTRLREFEDVLEDFTDVTVIWAHGGYTPLFLAERMLAGHPNLVYELSARTWATHPRSPDYTILRDDVAVWPEWIDLIERMPERFVVGTDASLRSAARDEWKIASVRNLLDQISADARRMVAGENLARILGIGN